MFDMFRKISSMFRSSQLITEMMRTAKWAQSGEGECWLDGVTLSQVRGGSTKLPSPSISSVCGMHVTHPPGV